MPSLICSVFLGMMTTLCVFSSIEWTDSTAQPIEIFFYHLCSLPIQLYLVDSFLYAASVTSAAAVSLSFILLFSSSLQSFIIQLFRSLFGFIFPLFGQPMFDELGLGGGNSVCFSFSVYLLSWNGSLTFKQLLAGFAIVIGIPFPIWIYYKGETLRARNPLTKASTIPKRIS